MDAVSVLAWEGSFSKIIRRVFDPSIKSTSLSLCRNISGQHPPRSRVVKRSKRPNYNYFVPWVQRSPCVQRSDFSRPQYRENDMNIFCFIKNWRQNRQVFKSSNVLNMCLWGVAVFFFWWSLLSFFDASNLFSFHLFIDNLQFHILVFTSFMSTSVAFKTNLRFNLTLFKFKNLKYIILLFHNPFIPQRFPQTLIFQQSAELLSLSCHFCSSFFILTFSFLSVFEILMPKRLW